MRSAPYIFQPQLVRVERADFQPVFDGVYEADEVPDPIDAENDEVQDDDDLTKRWTAK